MFKTDDSKSKNARRRARGIIFLLLSCMCACFTFGACLPACRECFYDYHVLWYCEDPYILFAGDRHYGFMELDGKNYMLDIGWSSNGSVIYFHDESKIGNSGLSDNTLIWEAETKLEDGQLILTIVKDNVSTYDGKIITLNQRPIEDDDNY